MDWQVGKVHGLRHGDNKCKWLFSGVSEIARSRWNGRFQWNRWVLGKTYCNLDLFHVLIHF